MAESTTSRAKTSSYRFARRRFESGTRTKHLNRSRWWWRRAWKRQQPTRINGCTGTDPWIEGRSRIEDPEDPPPLTHPLPRLSIPPAHFQPPRTLSFFSSPLNPLFLFVQRFLFSLERERERLRDATMPANKCKPIRSCRRRFAYDRLPSSRDFSHFRDQHLLIYPWTTRVNLG